MRTPWSDDAVVALDGFVPPVDHGADRIITFAALEWALSDEVLGDLTDANAVTVPFYNLGRLQTFYDVAGPRVPVLVAGWTVAREALRVAKCTVLGASLINAEVWLFTLQRNHPVAAVVLDVDVAPNSLPSVVEAAYRTQDLRFIVEGRGGHSETLSLPEFLTAMVLKALPENTELPPLEVQAEFYQLIAHRATRRPPNPDRVQRNLYRADLPARRSYSAIEYPKEMNRRRSWTCAVHRFAALLHGQQEYIEGAACLYLAQHVAAASTLRRVLDDVQRVSADFDKYLKECQTASIRLRKCVRQAETWQSRILRFKSELAQLELQLEAVYSALDIFLIVESGRIHHLQDSVARETSLRDNLHSVTYMLDRVRRALEAERAAIDAVLENYRASIRAGVGVAVAFFSAVALPVSLIFTFFGGKLKQVGDDPDLLDLGNFALLYAFAGVIALLLLLTPLAVGVRRRQSLRRDMLHRKVHSRRADGGPLRWLAQHLCRTSG